MTNSDKTWIFTRNRSLGPIVILAILFAVYLLSPYLPETAKEFMRSLR